MATLTLYCRASPESAWSRLNTITYGAEPNEADRKRAEAAAVRTINRYRVAWAHTVLPDHEFLITDKERWPVAPPREAVSVEPRIPEPAL